jgi:hypothetical protein
MFSDLSEKLKISNQINSGLIVTINENFVHIAGVFESPLNII